MLKTLLRYIINLKKNKDFEFDEDLNEGVLLSFAFSKIVAVFRSLKLLLCGKFVFPLFLGRNVQFFYLRNIQFGKWISVGDYSFLSALGKHELIIGDCVNIGSFCRIVISTTFNNLGEYIRIGNHVAIGAYSCIAGSGGTIIGDNTIIGQYFSVHPENHNYNCDNILIRKQGTERKSINIGSNCWIGSKVTVLAGVDIGNNCVIGAGSVVTKNIPSNCVAAGNPAKIIKTR